MTYLNSFSEFENNGDGVSVDDLSAIPDHWYSGSGDGALRGLYGVGAIGAKAVGLAAAGAVKPLTDSALGPFKYAIPDKIYDSVIEDIQDPIFKSIVQAPAEKRLEFMSHNKTTASQIAYGLTEGVGSMIYGGVGGGAISQGINKAEETIAEGGSVNKAYAKGLVQGGAFYLGAKVAPALPVLEGSGVLSSVVQKAITGGAINTAMGVGQRIAEQGIEAATDGKFDPNEILNYKNSAIDFGMGAAFGILGKTNNTEFKDLPIEQKDAALSVVEDAWVDGKIPEVETASEAKNIQLDLIETEKALDENRDPAYLAERVDATPEAVTPKAETTTPKAEPKSETEQVLGEYDGINLDEMAKQFDDSHKYLDEDGTVKTFADLKTSAVKDIEESTTTIDKLKQVVECILGGGNV